MSFYDDDLSKIHVSFSNPLKSLVDTYTEQFYPLASIINTQELIRGIAEPLRQLQGSIANEMSFVALDAINESLLTIRNTISVITSDLPAYRHLAEYALHSFSKSLQNMTWISTEAKDILQNFSSNIEISDDQVCIPKDSLESISSMIKLPDTSGDLCESSLPVASTFSFREFFSNILFPLFLTLLPMLQAHYYNERSALEAQKESLENKAYQEQCLQLAQEEFNTSKEILSVLQQIVESLNDIEESLNMIEESQQSSNECHCEFPEYPVSDRESVPDDELSAVSDNLNMHSDIE